MSNQPKSAEIEDVLSSIRRLVAGSAAHRFDDGALSGAQATSSDDDETAAGEPGTTEDDTVESTNSDALVLTQALRVPDNGADAPQEASRQNSEGEFADGADSGETASSTAEEWPDLRAWQDDAEQDSSAAASARAVEDDAAEPPMEPAPVPDEDVAEEASDAAQPDEAVQAAGNTSRFFQTDESVATHRDGDPGAETPAARTDPSPEESAGPQTNPEPRGQSVPEAPRQGFGFGAARREDPVRHVPLSELPPAASARDEHKNDVSGPQASPAEEVKDLPADSAENGVESCATPTHRKTPIIAPEFSHRPVSRALSGGGPPAPPADPTRVAETPVDPEPVSTSKSATDDSLGSADEHSHDSGIDPPPSAPEPLVTMEEDTEARQETEDPDVLVEDEDLHRDRVADPVQPPSGDLSRDDPETDETAHALAPSYRASLNLFNARDPEIDEEVLRAMIVEIVHKELQGALGERVSQNIRKLVQREITKALESRDLD